MALPSAYPGGLDTERKKSTSRGLIQAPSFLGFVLKHLRAGNDARQNWAVGQFPARERGAEGGLFLLAFQKGDCILRSG
jgi:hypothetical protein